MECPTLAHARREALRLAGYTLMNRPQKFWNGEPWTVEVVRVGVGEVFKVVFCAENTLPDEWLE
jgi:hypothetical protein